MFCLPSIRQHPATLSVMQKHVTTRTATASAIVQLNDTAFTTIASSGTVAKGDALTVAQLAGMHNG